MVARNHLAYGVRDTSPVTPLHTLILCRRIPAISEFLLLAGGVYQTPDAGRRQRQFVRRGSERRERGGDRIGHQPADRDDAAFASSFHPERMVGDGRCSRAMARMFGK